MKTRIEFVQVSNGYCWFVDAWINGGWKNIDVFKTECAAQKRADSLRAS